MTLLLPKHDGCINAAWPGPRDAVPKTRGFIKLWKAIFFMGLCLNSKPNNSMPICYSGGLGMGCKMLGGEVGGRVDLLWHIRVTLSKTPLTDPACHDGFQQSTGRLNLIRQGWDTQALSQGRAAPPHPTYGAATAAPAPSCAQATGMPSPGRALLRPSNRSRAPGGVRASVRATENS